MPSSQTGEPLLRVEGLVKYFPILQGILFKKQVGTLKAVDGVTFDLHPRETLGLVGESGCGKSTVAKTILRLDEPTEGKAYFEGRDIFAMNKKELRSLR
ncbi:MAG: ABC transporter ATP-binding protein, partial [Acidimicrobiia bacterium]|nr:ABC transporter ATP-binding protein [Acidimicrobiia bacterium]